MNYINLIAEKASKFKLIPFLGAGCSILHLSYGWDNLVNEMKEEVNSNSLSNLGIAQDYLEQKGKQGLCEFLERRLLIQEFEDEKGYADLAIMNLGMNVIYTTNQDNVMEKCLEKYGRQYKKITNLEDLSESIPGEVLYIKFHGDFSDSNSVVFAASDYEKRMNNSSNFLDIRLRSDLLGKSLFFVGYGFRDDNIRKIFEEVNKAFEGQLPESYLLAYSVSEELTEICNKYNVTLIYPRSYFPELTDNDAFEKFLYELAAKSFALKSSKDIQDIFSPNTPRIKKTISKMEVSTLKNTVETLPFDESIDKFRVLLDRTEIPLEFEKNVECIYLLLCEKTNSNDNISKVEQACFNLLIHTKNIRVNILAYTMMLGNKRTSEGSMFDYYMPRIQGVPTQNYIIATVFAIKNFRESKIEITDQFRRYATTWIEQSMDVEEFDSEVQQYIREQIDYAWSKPTTLENPLKRIKRLKESGFHFKRRTYEDIMNNMMNSIQKEFKSPPEN